MLAHIIALKLAWCVFVEVSERTPGESHALLNVLLESLEYLEADAFALFQVSTEFQMVMVYVFIIPFNLFCE